MSSPAPARRFGRRHLFGLLAGVGGVAATSVLPRLPRWLTGGSSSVTITVNSSTEKAGVIDEIIRRYNQEDRTVRGLRARVDPTSRLTSGDTKNLLVKGMPNPPVVWLPTSSMWLRLLENEGAGNRVEAPLGSVATSTLVIAMPKSVADALAATNNRLSTWVDVLELAKKGWSAYGKPEWYEFRLARDNPKTSTSGLAATVATYLAAARGDISLQRLNDPLVVKFVHDIESSVWHPGDEAVQYMQEIYNAEQAQTTGTYRPYIDAIVIQEQIAYLYNRGNPGGDPAQLTDQRRPNNPLIPVYPRDGTLELDHPFVVLNSATADERAVAEDFYEFLISTEQQKILAEAGFRRRDAAAHPTPQLTDALGTPPDQNLNFVKLPDGALLAAMQNSWSTVKRHARLLLVLDVSGSMDDLVDDPARAQNPTKLELMSSAAMFALDLLTDADEVGLWTFSSTITKVISISRLGDVRDDLKARIQGLTASGGTALYQVIDEANQLMQTLDRQLINAIVVLSDGKNTVDYPNNAAGLLTKLDPQSHETSVRIFTIPYGSDAEIDTLADISELTKATQYDASNPLTVNDAFVNVFHNFG